MNTGCLLLRYKLLIFALGIIIFTTTHNCVLIRYYLLLLLYYLIYIISASLRIIRQNLQFIENYTWVICKSTEKDFFFKNRCYRDSKVLFHCNGTTPLQRVHWAKSHVNVPTFMKRAFAKDENLTMGCTSDC